MDQPRWDRLQGLVHEAAECPSSERRPFLERRCSGEPELVADVLAMLEDDAQASPLDSDVGHVAADLVGAATPTERDSQGAGHSHPRMNGRDCQPIQGRMA